MGYISEKEFRLQLDFLNRMADGTEREKREQTRNDILTEIKQIETELRTEREAKRRVKLLVQHIGCLKQLRRLKIDDDACCDETVARCKRYLYANR